jgi:hypothetical protein
MIYFIAAVAASGLFITAGWRSKRTRAMAMAQGRPGIPNDPLWGDVDIDVNTLDSRTDVAGAIRLALKRLAPLMTSQSVQVDVAAPSGLFGCMRAAMLTDLLEELLDAAVHAAPGSRLLLTAAMHGDRIYVGIMDDMPGADPEARMSGIRNLIERVALRGGALDIDVRPAEGTMMTLRLAAAIEDRPDWKERAAPEPSVNTMVHSGAAIPR